MSSLKRRQWYEMSNAERVDVMTLFLRVLSDSSPIHCQSAWIEHMLGISLLFNIRMSEREKKAKLCLADSSHSISSPPRWMQTSNLATHSSKRIQAHHAWSYRGPLWYHPKALVRSWILAPSTLFWAYRRDKSLTEPDPVKVAAMGPSSFDANPKRPIPSSWW
jgi:hypothetical protein